MLYILLNLSIFSHPYTLLETTEIRAKALSVDCAIPMKCKCPSCVFNVPPFKSSGLDNISAALRQLLHLVEGQPFSSMMRTVQVDRAELKEYENSIIEHLQRMDQLHPTEATLKLQFLLMQIWNNLYSINTLCYIEPFINSDERFFLMTMID